MPPRFPAALPPPARAAFATASRILSCLVTEALLSAIFVPARSSDGLLVGSAILLVPESTVPHEPEHVFALVPVRHVPILRPGTRTIAMLNPLDILPYVYEAQRGVMHIEPSGPPHWETELRGALAQVLPDAIQVAITPSPDPICLWNKFANTYGIVDAAVRDVITKELLSSVAWQQYAYEHIPPSPPTFDSPSIAWEQCLVEGHPTHPMHKTRHAFPPIPAIQPGDYDWLRPVIYFVAVPRTSMYVNGAWDDLIAPFCAAAAANAGAPIDVPKGHILVPVHALQIPNIQEKFPEAHLLPKEYHIDALAQQSLRSVVVPSVDTAHTLKLPFGLRLTSAIRTISPEAAFFGPRFSGTILPVLVYDRTLLVVLREHGSTWHTHPDTDIARHLAAIVRDAYDENTNSGERVIVCTGLTETAYGGEGEEVSLAQIVFGLDTREKREAWFDNFVDVLFRAFLPPALESGVAFEPHAQNTLARFDAETRELRGFAIRDLGGLRLHAGTLLASKGAKAQGLRTLDDVVAPGHQVLADELDDVYARLYHALIHNHIQQLARVLGLHHDGAAWTILRNRLAQYIPAGHVLRTTWLASEAETLPTKSFLRMRMQNMYREHLYAPFPNLINYKAPGDLKN